MDVGIGTRVIVKNESYPEGVGVVIDIASIFPNRPYLVQFEQGTYYYKRSDFDIFDITEASTPSTPHCVVVGCPNEAEHLFILGRGTALNLCHLHIFELWTEFESVYGPESAPSQNPYGF